MDNNSLYAILFIGFIIFMTQHKDVSTTQVTTTTQQNQSGSSISQLIDSSVIFNGQDIYNKGNDISAQSVRIFKLNGEKSDLGYKTLNGGTLSTTPNDKYRFFYYMNSSPSSQYYVNIEDYTAPVQQAPENKIGYGCKIDTALTFSAIDQYERTQTVTANIIAITTGEEKDVTVRIKSHSDLCYGMPNQLNKQNAICFLFTSAFDGSGVQVTSSDYISAPTSISLSSYAAGKSISCYKMSLLANGKGIDIPVHLKAATDPTNADNITVMSDDIAFYINSKNLEEAYDYVDQDGNQLASTAQYLGQIRVQ